MEPLTPSAARALRAGVVTIVALACGCTAHKPRSAVPSASVDRARQQAVVQASSRMPAQAPVHSTAQTPATEPTRDEALLRAAEAHRAALIGDLQRLVNIDSGSSDAAGLSAVSEFLAQRLRDLGGNVTSEPSSPADGPIVRATFDGAGAANILLMIHYDTVFAHGEAQKRPFTVEGNRARGPGVADAKGGVAIILHALDIARQRGANNYKRLTVLFNPDEETGSLGSRDAIRSAAAEADYVLSFEPPGADSVTVTTNGVAVVELKVTGQAAHASMPEKGQNAAIGLAELVMKLRNLGDPAKGTTVTWTKMDAGDLLNVVPGSGTAAADMRYSDKSELQRVLNDANAIIHKQDMPPGTDAIVTVQALRPPFPRTEAGEQLAATARRIYAELGRPLEPIAMPFATDAGYAYQPGKSRPAVIEGMGIVGSNLHSPDEWADLDSITPRLYLTVRLIESLGNRPLGG